jgi:predicted DsbA family dithiol-disulfide isomerase
MTSTEWLDTAQTTVLLVLALAVIYALYLLRIELRQASAGLREVFRHQKEIEEAVERLWKRIDEIEVARGLRIDFDQIGRIKRLLDALEAAGGNKPGG